MSSSRSGSSTGPELPLDLTERLLDENRMIWVRTVGMVYGQQSAVVDEVVSDQIIVPLAAMHRRDLAALIESGVSELDAAAYRIGLFGVNLAEACGLPPAGHDDPNAPLKVFQANAFTVLDPIVRRWLASLSKVRDICRSLPAELRQPRHDNQGSTTKARQSKAARQA